MSFSGAINIIAFELAKKHLYTLELAFTLEKKLTFIYRLYSYIIIK